MRKPIILAAVALSMSLGVALAQEWPSRPITLVVPFAAGGGIDVGSRLLAQRMGELLGQTIKAIAIMADARSPILPDVPTTGEQGLAGVEASAWNA